MFDKVMHIMHSAYIHTELVTSHFRISFNTLVSRVIILMYSFVAILAIHVPVFELVCVLCLLSVLSFTASASSLSVYEKIYYVLLPSFRAW